MSDVGDPVLLGLDDRHRQDHYYLSAGDRCFYFYVYRPGSRSSGVNRLIRNFKCPLHGVRHDARRARSKAAAIRRIAMLLRTRVPRQLVEGATWIPIPTSMPREHPEFDNRLEKALHLAFADYDRDVRPALRVLGPALADHFAGQRLRLEALQGLIAVDRAALRDGPLRERIVLFDDLLTSGKHYRCCERALHDVLPGIPISGCFIARRVPPRRLGQAAAYGKWAACRPCETSLVCRRRARRDAAIGGAPTANCAPRP